MREVLVRQQTDDCHVLRVPPKVVAMAMAMRLVRLTILVDAEH